MIADGNTVNGASMSAFGCSYIGSDKPRQSPLSRAAALVALVILAVALGGCSTVGVPFGETADSRVSYEPTAATLVSAVTFDRVDPMDWEAVRRAVASVPADAISNRVEWSNPETGSTGIVAVLELPVENGAVLCRPLSTTVNDVRGVRRYRGEACVGDDGLWRLRDMTADDAQLL